MRGAGLETGSLRRKESGLGGKNVRTWLLVKEMTASLPILNPVQEQGHLLLAQPSLQTSLHFTSDDIGARGTITCPGSQDTS